MPLKILGKNQNSSHHLLLELFCKEGLNGVDETTQRRQAMLFILCLFLTFLLFPLIYNCTKWENRSQGIQKFLLFSYVILNFLFNAYCCSSTKNSFNWILMAIILLAGIYLELRERSCNIKEMIMAGSPS